MKLRNRHHESSPTGRQSLKAQVHGLPTAKAESFLRRGTCEVLALTLNSLRGAVADLQCLEAFLCNTALIRLGCHRSHQLMQQRVSTSKLSHDKQRQDTYDLLFSGSAASGVVKKVWAPLG